MYGLPVLVNLPAICAVVAVAISVVTGAVGYRHGKAMERTETQRCRAEMAEQKTIQAEKTAQALAESQKLADGLILQLQEKQTESENLKRERDNAIKTKTQGKPCLSADAVRLLNSTSLDVSDPSGRTAPQSAGIPATDTDIALWASEAQSRYGECARRLNALIDYWQGGKK